MSRITAGYEVGRFTGTCAATGQPLQPGTPCVAALCEREGEEGFDRLDYSLAAWEAGPRPASLFSYWKTAVPEPGRTRRIVMDDTVLLDLFARLEEDQRPQRQAFRFVLGLALIRKKCMKCVGRRQDGDLEWWLLSEKSAPPDTSPREMLNPRLTDDDIRTVAEQLSDVLQGEI